MKWFPVLGVDIEQMYLTISICILSTNQEDLAVRDGQGAAGPEWVLHPNSQHLPLILINLIHFNGVVDLLLSAAEETSEGVYVFVGHGAGT